ncbi:MAG: hypothetical protein ACAH17_00660 [Candidatus Paceibacterota bacterium]
MDVPTVKEGEWIVIGSGNLKGYVFNKNSDGSLAVGYYQNHTKAIKEDVIWNGTHWKFKYDGPNGSYLSGHEEAIVKQGP